MQVYLRLLRRSTLILLPVLLSLGVQAQVFYGEKQPNAAPLALKKVLSDWEIYRIDPLQIKRYLNENGNVAPVQLHLGKHDWTLDLQPNQILAPNYTLQVSTDQGVEVLQRNDIRTYKGTLRGAPGRVRMTVDNDFLHGFVEQGGERYYIEPLWYHDPSAKHDLFLVYPISAVIRDQDVTCIELSANEEMQYMPKEEQMVSGQADMACYTLEIAIAADHSMFVKYGSVSGVENHNIAIINDVQGDYTGSFNHDLTFNIVTQFVVTGTDPWTSSTNAGQLLDSFTNWGNSGNFGVSFDNAELWTNRDFDGSTVGIAWLQGICNSNKYHCLQDFTSNSELLRCMTSHEIGHNFSAGHDTGGGVCPPNYIMCPFVSTSTQWSSNSQNSINNYMQIKINSGCLAPCSSGPPLVADFSWDPNPPCQGVQVQFSDMSTGNITGRSWVFPGGTPATSTAMNPLVTFSSAGVKNVSLTLTGAGGPVTTTKQVTVQPMPTANFTYIYTDLTYTFTSTSQNATSYEWNFGDGDVSTDQNPTHVYAASGIYTVTLTVTNSCGSSTKTTLINTIPTAGFSGQPTNGCAPQVVIFTNQSSSNAVSYLWQFPGGTPSASNLATPPPVVYNTSGTYTVTLTVNNPAGSNTFTQASYITIQNIPSATFTYAVNGQTVNFTNNSGGATSTLWNFGDGETSTQTSPSHTYAVGGVYTVTLTSTNNCGSTTATQTITLLAPPTASFTADTTIGCGSLTVHFTSTSGGNPSSYAWTFAGGTPGTSTSANPTVVYNAPGSYTVTLVATNAAGSNTATQTNYITLLTPPTAGFTSATNGLTATFTNTSTGGSTYAWNFGDGGTSNLQNPTHTYAADGVYTVTLTVTNLCGTTTSSQTVTIVTPPTASFTATPTTGCGPLTVQFTNTSSSNATSYAWSFPGGTPSTSIQQNPSVVYNIPGTYTVTLTVSNAAGSNTSTQTSYVTVNPGPTAGFTSAVNGAVVNFTNSSSNSVSYSWAFGDGGTSTQPNPSHTYSADGTYTVTLTATNPCGTNTFTQSVVISTPPTASFTATPTSGCGPLTVQFTSTSSANASSFNWSFPGGTPSSSTQQNPSVVYNAPGTYTVTLTVSNAAGSNSSTQTNYITVNPGPTAGFTAAVNGAIATFTNTSANATSYSWNFGDGGTSTLQNPGHTYANDGTYTVALTATNACGSNTSTQTVTIATPPTAAFTASPTSGCGPLTVQFTNASSANASTFSWSFPGGTPSTSTAQNPTVTYNAPGTYTVVLTVSNTAGSNTATQTNLVTVNPGPTAGFTSTTDSTTAVFTNTSANGVSYSWNFGDGATSTIANPSHTYASDGTYTVTLTTTNPCGTATFTQNVVIITSPNAGFTANVTTGCGPLSVQFEDLSSENTTGWSWNFPGGIPETSTEQNPVVVYNLPGTYDVTLVASTSAGTSTFTQFNFITVLPLPSPAFTSSVSGPTATFTNTSQNASSYLWDFGDGSSSSQTNPVHTYTADGTYTVTLTATNNCGSITISHEVTAVTLPQAGFAPSISTGCFPLTVNFNNTSSANATSFAWTFEGGTPATSSEENPSAAWSQPGVYTVTLVVGNSAGTATATSTITVTGPPIAAFNSQTAGLSVVLTNTSSNATSYLWDFGDGKTGTEANPTHEYASTGTYTVVLTAGNACGTTQVSKVVEIAGTAPLAAFLASEVQGCIPLTVQFSDISAGNPTAWQWSFPGGTPASSTDQNPSVTYSTIGNYDVTLVATNIYGSNTTTQTSYIQVIDVPSAQFTYAANQTTVMFTNNSVNGVSYFWNFGDGNTSTEANPTHTYASGGNYTVELTATNACGASTRQLMIMLTSGATEVAWLDQFRLYPNPSNGQFTLDLSGDAREGLDILLYNAIGQLQRRETVSFDTGTLLRQFDYSTLPAGMYTLEIRAGASAVQVKLAIQR